MLALLLLSILTFAFGARLVEADGMILPFSSLPYAPLAYAQTALADTINNCRVDSFADPVTIHFAATMGTTSLQQYDSVIFSNAYDCFYAKTLADIDGYTSSSLESKVKSALTSMPMIGNMPRTYQSYWLVYDRYMINAYRWSQQWNIETAKWNETQAAEEAINCYHKAGRAVLGLNLDRGWIFSDRYYDENGQTLDIMNKLGSSSDALAIWNYLNSAHWNGQIYTYTPGGGFECEVGPFAMLIGYYHATNPTIPYFDRINLDLYNKMLKNGWSSPAWSSSPGVMQHAWCNSEKRLENTLDGFTALQAYYCLGSTDYKQAFQSLLTDSPKAWEALVSSPLYSSGKFSWREGQSVSDAATASGMMLLLLEGIVPDTGCLAIPLNEWRYQDQATMLPYTHFRFDYSSRRIRIPVFAGSIKFQFGTSVANATFTSNGIYEVQFSSDWNSVLEINLVSPLSDQFYYLQPTGTPPPPPSQPTIYIRADGSIDPSGVPISRAGDIYTLIGDISSFADGIVIERDNMTLDGAGYTLTGSGSGDGITLTDRSNLTLVNMEITRFNYGIRLYYSSNNTIVNSTVTANGRVGIDLYYSSNNSMLGNNVTGNVYGISLEVSSNNRICGNIFTNDGLCVRMSYANSVENNTVNGRPLVYLEDVSDCNVQEAGQVILVRCHNIMVDDLNISETDIGIQLLETNNSIIAKNKLANNLVSMYLWVSLNNTISGNNLSDNFVGIWLYCSSNTKIFHNNFNDNIRQTKIDPDGYNAWDDGYPSGGNYWSDYIGVDADIDGIGDAPYVVDADNQDRYPLMHPWGSLPVHNINTGLGYDTIQEAINANETLNGQTIFVEAETYYENIVVNKSLTIFGENKDTTIIVGSPGYSAFDIESNNVHVLGFTMQNASNGVISHAQNVTVDNNLMINCENSGLQVTATSNTIRNNFFKNCGTAALFYGDNHIIEQNTFMNNRGWSIQLSYGSSNNKVAGNIIINNDGTGIFLQSSHNNTISANALMNNLEGIRIGYSTGNLIFHNNLVNNTRQVFIDPGNINTVWDFGYPSGGNYWSDYSGVDANGDGIGDAPYPIDENNQDRYPLMKPWTNIVISEVTSPRNIIGQGYASYIYVSVQNQGWNTETIDITIYANTTPTIQEQMALASRSSVNATLIWDSSSLSKGNYTISAYAQPVSGETDTEDNNCPGGWILITKVGDLGGGVPPAFFDCDGSVDGKDLALFLQCYIGTALPKEMYLGDLGGGVPPQFYDCDGNVDGKDLALFLQCYRGLGP
jgi:parallel beta-helix repeat protein